MRSLHLPLLGLLAASPLAAVAPPCSSGSFSACASVTITTTYRNDPQTGLHTDLEIAIRNISYQPIWFVNVANVPTSLGGKQLRGNDPNGPNSSGLVNYFARGAVGHAPGCDPSQGFGGPGYSCDWLDAGWDTWCDPSQYSPCWPDEYEMWPTIWGCGVDPATLYKGLVTCDALGFTGSAVFTFDLEGQFSPQDLTVYLNNGEPCEWINGVLQPTTTSQCPSTAPVTVTPEPTTWALMVTGLAGVAAITRRRRSRPVG